MLFILIAAVSVMPANPTSPQVRMALFQGGTPASLTVTVMPPAPAQPYSVVCTFGTLNGHLCWLGPLPAGAKAPAASTQMIVNPWLAAGMGTVNPVLPDGSWDYTKIVCRITFAPAAGNADLGGGLMFHNPSPSISAGPTFWPGAITKGYSFTVGP